jgi:biotin operon repressor
MAIHQPVRERPATKDRMAGRRRVRRDGKRGDWSLLSAQGRVLFYVAVCPDSPVEEIARNLDLTERAVWGVVRDLRSQGMIQLRKRGRRHHYVINLDAPFLHPTIRGLTLRPLLGEIAARAFTQRPEVCDT